MQRSKDRISPMRRKKYSSKKDGRWDIARCRVSIGGIVTYYTLGRWGSTQADDEYRRRCAEFYAGTLAQKGVGGITLAGLFNRFLDYAEKKYKNKDFSNYKKIIRVAAELYPDLPVVDFKREHGKTIQGRLIQIAKTPTGTIGIKPPTGQVVASRSWSRQYINCLMKHLRLIFNWGVDEELISSEPAATLMRIKALKPEECPDWVEDREPVAAVADWIVVKTLPFMQPIIADMVKIQRAAGMRPSEVCSLRVGDIDRSEAVWKVKDATGAVGTRQFKTAKKVKFRRYFYFGDAEIGILKRRMAGKSADEYIFSPRDAQKERWEKMAAKRKSKKTPSQIARDASRAEGKLLKFHEFYTSDSYRRGIENALKKAEKQGTRIPHWFPYQLRHACYTSISHAIGPEKASKILGHASVNMAEVYDHSAETTTKEYAESRSIGWWEPVIAPIPVSVPPKPQEDTVASLKNEIADLKAMMLELLRAKKEAVGG